MKKLITTAALIAVLCIAPAALAEEEETPKLGVTLDSTFVSKYMWRGYDILGDHGAWQPSVDLDLFGTGFSFNVWMSIAMSGGLSALNEIDYTLAYGKTLFEDEPYALDVGVNYIYYDFPRIDSTTSDAEEAGVSLELGNLIKVGNSTLVPSYYVGRLYPADDTGGPKGGTFHILALGYDLPIPRGNGQSQVISFAGDATYNTGAYNANPDWSHATFSVSTGIEVGKLTIAPSLNYQISMDDSVHNKDEAWAGLGISCGF
jgi:hypothetical protein